MPKYLLSPTTESGTSDPFTVASRPASVIAGALRGMPAHIAAPGLAGEETVTLQQQDPDGNWFDYQDSDGKLELTASRTNVAIYAPGVFRLQKDSTAAAVGIQISTELQA